MSGPVNADVLVTAQGDTGWWDVPAEVWRTTVELTSGDDPFPGRRIVSIVSAVLNEAENACHRIDVSFSGAVIGGWRSWNREGVLTRPARPLVLESYRGGWLIDAIDDCSPDRAADRAEVVARAWRDVDDRGAELWRALLDLLAGGSAADLRIRLEARNQTVWPATTAQLFALGDLDRQVIAAAEREGFRVQVWERGRVREESHQRSVSDAAQALADAIGLPPARGR